MNSVDIQLIRNATLKLNYGGKTLLVDPMLGEKNSMMSFVVPDQNLNPTVDLPFSKEEVIEGTDAMLLTHAHPDHIDPTAIELLNKDLPVFSQDTEEQMLKDAGFTQVTPITTSATFDGIEIERTGGKHGPEEVLDALGQVSGFVLRKSDYPTIYIIGDCLLDDEITENIKMINPDIIITNSGGAIFMGQARILMDESETVKVAQLAPNAKVIATHIESLDHCQVTRTSLTAAAAEAGVEVLIPADGEVISF
ncbi:MBL fold metallo-hydrolase [Flammeovirga sp. SubArs3]|uniref:MBL fold metallo-hydrolase n=1 Tax=Flammeovirga sp. SubArs3 TaxID=2995316 RepID=UPI00248C7A57|nr:MBL fold metallo-hydrolase [Flammeovirga sp. SubArs3]